MLSVSFFRTRNVFLGVILLFFLGTYYLDWHRKYGRTDYFSTDSHTSSGPKLDSVPIETGSSSSLVRPHPAGPLAPTTIPGGAVSHGFTTLDQLYLRQGTMYIVTEDPSQFPARELIISSGKNMEIMMELGEIMMEPTDKQLRFINRKEAKEILGERATRVRGFTMILWEDKQFMVHLYHFWGEIIIGAWRVYSHLSGRSDAADLPMPTLFILPHCEADSWRDRADIDGPYMRAAFPDAAIETSRYWNDLIKLNTTVVFDRVLIADRHTAHKHPFSGIWFKMIAGTMNVTAPVDFWAPVRNNIVRNLLGYVPKTPQWTENDSKFAAASARNKQSLPLVTYISRQATGRRLLQPDHDVLVQELLKLQKEGLCEVHVAIMERLSLKEQVALVSRSTIMIGVHGNGLTNQLWMPPSPRSATFEIFYPPGYTFDYEILARNMGHRHYAVHNDTLITFVPGKFHESVAFPDGFHGENIPVYGPTIARQIREILQKGHPL